MRPFYRKDLFRDEIIKIMPKELSVKADQDDKKLSVLKMEKGQSYSLCSDEYEVGLVILSGTATIKAGDFIAENKGSRKDVFSGQPTMIYIPRKTEYTVIATGYGILEVALCMHKTEKAAEPFVIEAESIEKQSRGVLNWQRKISEIVTPEKADCDLIIGETYGCPGSWATYPYADNDDKVIFFFKILPNPGRPVQVIRNKENTQLYCVTNDTALAMEESYLPVAKVDECEVYTLWFKARA